MGFYRGYIGIREKKMETTIYGLGFGVYSPPSVDRIWAYGDLVVIYTKPYSIYLRGTIS